MFVNELLDKAWKQDGKLYFVFLPSKKVAIDLINIDFCYILKIEQNVDEIFRFICLVVADWHWLRANPVVVFSINIKY